jgi:muconate cycloisomerase
MKYKIKKVLFTDNLQMNTHISKLTIYRLALPFRGGFKHATAERSQGDNVIIQLELGNGTIGFGETLARPYVTGETPDSVIEAVQRVFLPILMEFKPEGFGEVFELLEKLPLTEDGSKPLFAARCAVELAVLDAYGKQFNRSPEVLAGWIDEPKWELPGAAPFASYTGVIGAMEPKKAARLAMLMRLWRIRDFKVKVGDSQEFDRLIAIEKVLRRGIESGKVRLRVDANGTWRAEDLPAKVDMLERMGVLFLEQPTARRYDDSWLPVQHNSGVNLVADESLVSIADAERLTKEYSVGVFDIRIAKNGGLLPSLKMAAYAYSHGIEVQLGCMVGETGILNTAGEWFAGLVPELIFAEGGYGRWLLKEDIVKKPPKLRYGGRISTPSGPGLGVEVDMKKLKKYAASEPIAVNL